MKGVQITETSYIAKGLPHMGEYSEASIKLNAPFTEAAFQSSPTGYAPIMGDLVSKANSSFSPSKIIARGHSTDYNFLDLQNQDLNSQKYAFVFVSLYGNWCLGLALRQRSDTEYERIGTCRCYMNGTESNGDTSVEEQGVRSYLRSLPFREVKII